MTQQVVAVQGVFNRPYPEGLKKPGSSNHKATAIGSGEYTYTIFSATEITEHGPLRHASISKTKRGVPSAVRWRDIDSIRLLAPDSGIPVGTIEPFVDDGPFKGLGIHIWENPNGSSQVDR